MSDNPTKYEVLIKGYLLSILDISVSSRLFIKLGCAVLFINFVLERNAVMWIDDIWVAVVSG